MLSLPFVSSSIFSMVVHSESIRKLLGPCNNKNIQGGIQGGISGDHTKKYRRNVCHPGVAPPDDKKLQFLTIRPQTLLNKICSNHFPSIHNKPFQIQYLIESMLSKNKHLDI
jgi:hypothetical protein